MNPQKLLKPAVIAALIITVFSCLFAPMILMKPGNIPVAVVNNDQAITTPAGQMKVSEKVIEGLQQNPMLQVTDDIDGAYAVYTIPENFTATAAKKEKPQINVEVNQGKHPMVSQLLDAALAKAPADGPTINVTHKNEVPSNLGLAASFLPALFVLLTFIPSMIGGLLLARSIAARKIGAQFAALIGMNVTVGLMGILVYSLLSPVSVPYATVFSFLIFASFVVGSLTVGAVNLFGKGGMAIPALVLITGMGFMSMPREFLPIFWREWVYPWNPVRMIAESGREILYQGSGVITSPFWLLVVVASVGTSMMAIGAARRPKPGEAI
ncbi:YhgE/Pip domain-containing protein [Corynebacterium sp. H130]|uniref:YhgE/Pip domain-containing protein n=1 Tax=Corynebacterium sp. H130 TaxID=3133444 RepID=UPI0030A6E0F6